MICQQNEKMWEARSDIAISNKNCIEKIKNSLLILHLSMTFLVCFALSALVLHKYLPNDNKNKSVEYEYL